MAFLRYSKTIHSYGRGFSNCVILSLKCIDLTVHTFCHHLWFCRSAVLFDNTVLIPINGIRASYMFKYVKIETNQLGNFAHSTDGTVCIAQHMTCVYYFSLAKCLHLEKAHILDFLPGQGESKATDSSRSPSPSVKTMAPACFPCQGYWLVLTTFQGIICFCLKSSLWACKTFLQTEICGRRGSRILHSISAPCLSISVSVCFP